MLLNVFAVRATAGVINRNVIVFGDEGNSSLTYKTGYV
jgi:hypothetical protein